MNLILFWQKILNRMVYMLDQFQTVKICFIFAGYKILDDRVKILSTWIHDFILPSLIRLILHCGADVTCLSVISVQSHIVNNVLAIPTNLCEKIYHCKALRCYYSYRKIADCCGNTSFMDHWNSVFMALSLWTGKSKLEWFMAGSQAEGHAHSSLDCLVCKHAYTCPCRIIQYQMFKNSFAELHVTAN